MPKVLRIINRFNLGGPTFNAAYLTRYMPDEFETLLVGGQKDEHEASSAFIVEGLGIKPLILPEMRRSVGLMNDIRTYRKIKEIIADFKPDIVHTHASKAGAIGRWAAAAAKVPVIVHTFHGNVFKGYFRPIKNSIYKNIERQLAKRTHAIVAISELQKQELAFEHRICSPEKIHVIPLGFDLNRFHEQRDEKRTSFRRKWRIAEDEFVVSIIGRLVPIKNHRLFLEAFKYARDASGVKLRALIVGDGESRQELEKYCRETGLNQPDVTFTSWIREIDEVNAASDLIALSSDNEGTPVSLIEAQASGKAIVSTDVGGIRNIVVPGETALLSPKGDANALAENMLRLINNNEFRKKMESGGWDFVEKRFHYTRLVQDMSRLYLDLLKK